MLEVELINVKQRLLLLKLLQHRKERRGRRRSLMMCTNTEPTEAEGECILILTNLRFGSTLFQNGGEEGAVGNEEEEMRCQQADQSQLLRSATCSYSPAR